MSSTATANLTGLLRAWSAGDAGSRRHSSSRWSIRNYDIRPAATSPGSVSNHTLRPTALVNEAYLRLAGQRRVVWQDRAQFFAVAATVMRRLLVDHARQHGATKRGGCVCTVSLEDGEHIIASEAPDVDIIALNEALVELSEVDPMRSRMIELRFFAGLTTDETAEALGVSAATVTRGWRLARAWLHHRLTRGIGSHSRASAITAAEADPVYDARTLDASDRALRVGAGACARRARRLPGLGVRRRSGVARRGAMPCSTRTSAREASASRPPSTSPSTIEATLGAGSRLGRYEIVALIGAGGMGEVYRARDPQLGREVGDQDSAAARRGLRAISSSGLNGRRAPSARSIIRTSSPCYDIGTEAGVPYVVSELLEGETLRARHRARLRCRGRTRARHRPADRLGTDGGARQGHRPPRPQARERVHHDRGSGQDSRFRSGEADGGAGATRPAEARSRTSGLVMGTAGYMSPEQVRGHHADAASDVFAFGAVLYEMLTGLSRVHGRLGRRDDERDSDEGRCRRSRRRTPEVPAALDPIVHRCLEKAADRRFPSTRELAAALEAVRHSPTAVPHPTRSRWPAWSAAAVLVAAASSRRCS